MNGAGLDNYFESRIQYNIQKSKFKPENEVRLDRQEDQSTVTHFTRTIIIKYMKALLR